MGRYLFSDEEQAPRLTGFFPLKLMPPGILAPAGSGSKTPAGEYIAEMADTMYNVQKDMAIRLDVESVIRTEKSRPASAVGGSYWYMFGRMQYGADSDLNVKGRPMLLSEQHLELFQRFIDTAKVDPEIERQMMRTADTMKYIFDLSTFFLLQAGRF
jgi:hypothetical protein